MRLCKEKYGLIDRMIYVLGEKQLRRFPLFLPFANM